MCSLQSVGGCYKLTWLCECLPEIDSHWYYYCDSIRKKKKLEVEQENFLFRSDVTLFFYCLSELLNKARNIDYYFLFLFSLFLLKKKAAYPEDKLICNFYVSTRLTRKKLQALKIYKPWKNTSLEDLQALKIY